MKPPLSPAAQAVLVALTQSAYELDPFDIPNEAGRMACIASAARRAGGRLCHRRPQVSCRCWAEAVVWMRPPVLWLPFFAAELLPSQAAEAASKSPRTQARTDRGHGGMVYAADLKTAAHLYDPAEQLPRLGRG